MLTTQERMFRAVTEAHWQHQVEEIASLSRWMHWHAPDNRPVVGKGGKTYVQNVRAGFPDLVLVRADRLIFAELKKELGTISEDQQRWADKLAEVPGVEHYFWRPSDIHEVVRILR